MDTISGLPAHPLLVHIPVVLVPLCAIAVIAMAAHRGIFAKLSWIVLGLTGVSLVATFLAAEAGESLEHSIKETEAVEVHAEAGDQFRLIMLVFFLVVAAMVLWDRYQTRTASNGTAAATAAATADDGAAERTTTRAAASLGAASMAIRGVAVVAALIATFFVIDVGHSGAKSSWGDVKISSERGDHDEDGD